VQLADLGSLSFSVPFSHSDLLLHCIPLSAPFTFTMLVVMSSSLVMMRRSLLTLKKWSVILQPFFYTFLFGARSPSVLTSHAMLIATLTLHF
jgi:hypothetical protein